MDPFRLVSYNVRGFPWCDPPIKEIVAWLTKNSDIVALQEVWCKHAVWSAAFAAAGWVFLRPAREAHIAGLFGSGLAFAWPAAAWTLVDARQYPYLHATGLDQLAAKGWFRVELRRPGSAQSLRLINTHAQSDYDLFGDDFHEITEAVRMKQARQLASVEHKEPAALVVGDFNTDTCWIPGCQFLGASLTALPYTFPPSAQHLDHLASWAPDAWRVLEHTVFERIAWSDHVPVRWTVSTASRLTHR
jgi:endonuclease/exonuclease/phosphatase family metal-dependent hydrolase